MPDFAMIAERYIEAWNETNAERRRALLAETWTENATYTDPLMQGGSRAEIDALIAAVHTRFPGFRFALTGRPDGYGERLRFSWALGPEGGESIVKGTDFAVLDGERLKNVTGFLDQIPDAK